MTAALAELSRISADVGLTDHLAECDNTGEDWRSCRWCLWAIDTPEMKTLLDATHDCGTLRQVEAADTVAWVMAAVQLSRTIDELDTSSIHLGSVRDLAGRLRRELVDDMVLVEHRLSAASAAGGVIEQRCLRTAGAVAATALQMPGQERMLGRLPDPVRSRVSELAENLSPGTQGAYLLPALEHEHWQGLPTLRTQPEWKARAAPDDSDATRARQLADTNLSPGSLESLVVESVIDQVTEELAGIGHALADLAAPVTLGRSTDETPLSSRTRSLMWRSARVDWHLTFVDTGRADCWNPRVRAGRTLTDVPWHIALAIEATDHFGLVSATHRDRPSTVGVRSRSSTRQ